MISVLLPTFNQADFLPAALAGLQAQSFENFEIIACDDASTDETAVILDREKIRTVRLETNSGTAAALNAAFAMASGEFVTWVSSDNVMTPDWLETLVGAMADDVGAVYSAFWFEKPGHKPIVLYQPYEPHRQINQEACYFGPSLLMRTDVWRQAGEHRGRISHDLAHWLRVEEVCWLRGLKIVGIPTPLCHYNAHDNRVTITRSREYDSPVRLVEAQERRQCVASS